MRELVRESKELREKASAILGISAAMDASSIDLSARVMATRERIRASWERINDFRG